MANNRTVNPRQPGIPRQGPPGAPTPPAPPPGPDPAFVKGADGLYVGRNGTPTSLPQPFVDMLAPTNPMMPASFGQFVGPGLPLGRPVPPGTTPPANPQPLGPAALVPPTPPTPGRKKPKKGGRLHIPSVNGNPFA